MSFFLPEHHSQLLSACRNPIWQNNPRSHPSSSDCGGMQEMHLVTFLMPAWISIIRSASFEHLSEGQQPPSWRAGVIELWRKQKGRGCKARKHVFWACVWACARALPFFFLFLSSDQCLTIASQKWLAKMLISWKLSSKSSWLARQLLQ